MSRLLTITKCTQCKHLQDNHYGLSCGLNQKILTNHDIPKWCPLPSEESENEVSNWANDIADQVNRKNKSLIPNGYTCYNISKFGRTKQGLPYFETKLCPYWYRVKDAPEQESGGCLYLEKEDGDFDGHSLLWDQVKMCDIKHNYDEINDE